VLLAAAAKHWNVPVSELHTEPGVVKHTDGRSIGYGELAPHAATLPLPTEQPPLKDPKQWRILGTRTRVVDTEDIVTGRARYGLDSTLPGALVAVITRCPTFDGELKSFDATAAKKIPGVRDVIAVSGPKHGEPITANLAPGVAVIADNTWAHCKVNARSRSNGHLAPMPPNPPRRSMHSARSSSKEPALAPATTVTSTPLVPPPRKSSKQPIACHSSHMLRSSHKTPVSTFATTAY
jgi:hypothetical protein